MSSGEKCLASSRTREFVQTIQNDPVEAASQLFSWFGNLDFEVLVVDKEDHVKTHMSCQIQPGTVGSVANLPISGQQTTEVQAVAGPFYAGSQQPALGGALDGAGDSEPPRAMQRRPTHRTWRISPRRTRESFTSSVASRRHSGTAPYRAQA